MRLTRAAQRAQQPVEEPALDATDASEERSPLNEITPNASPEHVNLAEGEPKTTLTRTKSKRGGKKGAKAKKGKTVEEDQEPAADEPVAEEPQAADDAIEAAVEEPVAEPSQDAAPTAVEDERPASPAPKPVRLTRRQLAKQEEEMRQPQRPQSPPRPEPATEHVAQSPIEEAPEEGAQTEIKEDIAAAEDEQLAVETQPEATIEPEVSQDAIAAPESDLHQHTDTVEPSPVTEDTSAGAEAIDVAETNEKQAPELAEAQETRVVVRQPEEAQRSESEAVRPSVEVTSEPEPKTLATERPTDMTSTPALSRTPSRRTSRSASKSPMRIEESIEALDALEEALENVGKAVSHFDSSTEEKSPRKKAFPKNVTSTPSARAKTPRKTPVAARVSRAPSAAPKSMKPAATGIARASSVRVAPVKDLRKDSTETFDYLASKRRPVSVSFPTPPPPPKGRAPTKPTFQLSSETVAAKLKAQKEERLKREAEREAEGAPIKQRPISMPPVAKSTKAPTKANFQLPGEAIAAKLRAQKEEREKREAESAQAPQPKARPVSISMPPPTVKSTKPLTKATFQLSGDAVAAKLRTQREERQKREEEAEAAKKAAASKPRPTIRKPVALPSRAAPGVTIPPPPKPDSLQPPPSQRSTSLASKRSSVQLSRSVSDSTNGSNRNSLLIAKATVTPVDAVQQKLKGREVFNRDKMEKEAKERERREKEEAAKQARAQAAERGRIASREWAEKQRRKMMDAVRSKAEAA